MSTTKKGLCSRKLCDRFGWDYKTVVKKSRELGRTTHEHLLQETGWIVKDHLYYSPNTKFDEDD